LVDAAKRGAFRTRPPRAMLRDSPAELQDRRDFEEIRAWARQIAATHGAARVA